MFVAKDTCGNVVNSLVELTTKREFWCLSCQERVILKSGPIKVRHFAHHKQTNCLLNYERESREHLELKAKLFSSLVLYQSVYVEKALQELGQVADLLVNERLILEVQCSPLSISKLFKRSDAYYKAGYHVIWLLGEKLWVRDKLKPLHHHFLYFSKWLGFYLWELDNSRNILRLKYMIVVDIFGKCHYLVKEFSFKGNILSILRFPFRYQNFSSNSYRLKQDIPTFIQKQLYFKQKDWLKKQEEAYFRGENLLNLSNNDFYPYIFWPEDWKACCQIREDLDIYYRAFGKYYQKQDKSTSVCFYSPEFYIKEERI